MNELDEATAEATQESERLRKANLAFALKKWKRAMDAHEEAIKALQNASDEVKKHSPKGWTRAVVEIDWQKHLVTFEANGAFDIEPIESI